MKRFNLLITDVQFTEDSDEDWEPESDPETESTKHRLDTRSVHAMHAFLSVATGNLWLLLLPAYVRRRGGNVFQFVCPHWGRGYPNSKQDQTGYAAGCTPLAVTQENFVFCED